MTLRAGFVGLGNIGAPMAERLVGAGHETRVFDVRPEAVERVVASGAKGAASARALAEASDVVGVCVRDDAEVIAVCLGPEGLLAGARPGAVIALHSTILPETARQVAAAAAPGQVGVLDAPVSGGAAGAARGALVYMVGGDAAHLEKARPAFEASGRTILHAGALGAGAVAKLCNNVMTYLAWTAAYEATCLARGAGLGQDVLEQVTAATGNLTDPMRAFLAIHKAPDEARRSPAFQGVLRGHVEIAEKDLASALRLAREHGLALPGAGLCAQTMARVYGLEDDGRR